MLALTGSGGLHRNPNLFLAGAIGITVLSACYFFTINASRPPFKVQVHFQTIIDLLVLTLLIHASDGFQSGFGFLMIVTIAAASLLDAPRSAVAFAALGTLLALGEAAVSYALGYGNVIAFRGPGFLGVGLFSTAFVVSRLAQRIRFSEEAVTLRESAIADLNALNHMIVERIPTGVLAIDNDNRVVLCNARARAVLDLPISPEEMALENLAPWLHHWLTDTDNNASNMSRTQTSVSGNESGLQQSGYHETIHPSSEAFGGGRLVFLEDLSAERESARQTRLAALGRLAAAIAHEIRNPLSAVYQSAQLLSESTNLKDEDADIAQIIRKQSERIERIIASVLIVSRGDSGNPEIIDLADWLKIFSEQFAGEFNLADDAIAVVGESLKIIADITQLQQILTNLCENALAHTTRDEGELIRLESVIDPQSSCPYLEVIDYGRGIPENDRKRLFEPFFTTRARGTGLGLYIARELCEANHARLGYQSDRDETVFRITFYSRPNPDGETRTHH
ncbi:MAG: histidine kinase [marine bacterium B5-7]|nr:MAG: histidine kinase [marine bacterium B5-7]